MNQQNEFLVNDWLAEIKRLSAILDAEKEAYQNQFRAALLEYGRRTVQAKVDLAAAENQLIGILKKNKADIFPGKTDKVTLSGGVILHQIGSAVRKARHITVAFLRGKGLLDGVKIEESVNWQTIDTWPADRLKQIGTERKPKESFSYELS